MSSDTSPPTDSASPTTDQTNAPAAAAPTETTTVEQPPTQGSASSVVSAADAAQATIVPLFPTGFYMSVTDTELSAARAAIDAEDERRQRAYEERCAVLDARAVQIEQDAEQLRSDIELERQRAVESGRIEGLEQGQREAGAVIDAVSSAIDSFHADCASSVERGAFALCGLLLERELSLQPERIVEVVSHVWDRARSRSSAIIRVHPSRVEFVRGAVEGLRDRAPECSDIAVVPAADSEPHEISIQTDAGTCRFSLESWLAELRTHLERSAPTR